MYKWVHVFTRDIDLPHVYKNCNYIGFQWALHNRSLVVRFSLSSIRYERLRL